MLLRHNYAPAVMCECRDIKKCACACSIDHRAVTRELIFSAFYELLLARENGYIDHSKKHKLSRREYNDKISARHLSSRSEFVDECTSEVDSKG